MGELQQGCLVDGKGQGGVEARAEAVATAAANAMGCKPLRVLGKYLSKRADSDESTNESIYQPITSARAC